MGTSVEFISPSMDVRIRKGGRDKKPFRSSYIWYNNRKDRIL